jgi:hypothetical protein
MKLTSTVLGGSVVALVLSLFIAPPVSEAMPQFAQATGLQCSACHTLVPLLNAYGRYVQRTAYQEVPRDQMVKTFPIWLSEQLNYDSTSQLDAVPQFDAGNFAVHAVGYAAPYVTYHGQVWAWQNSMPGGVDTLWAAYNHVITSDAHLFVGKIVTPGPSFYSQTFSLDGPFASSSLIGEHNWGDTFSNRWGTKASFVRQGLDIEAGYEFSTDDLNGITDFNPGDKTFFWKAAYATPKSPLEVGLFGSVGTIPVSTGKNSYNSIAAYAQLDPGKHFVPGFYAVYQAQYDSNPGLDVNMNVLPALHTQGFSAEVFELLLRGNVLLGFRHDFNGLGPTNQPTYSGNAVDLAFNVPIHNFPYLHGYFEANLGANSSLYGITGGPQWKAQLWLTIPVTNPK